MDRAATPVDPAPTVARVTAALSGIEHQWLAPRDGMPSVTIDAARLFDALSRLKRQAGFETVTFVTALDHLPREPRFEVVHQLLSLQHNDRLRISTSAAAGAPVHSCIGLWPGAAYMERECFDMFGIVFEGHRDLKRLLMPEEYEHFPLRKDFPHQGIEPDRLYREWDRKRRLDWHPEAEQGAR